MNISQEGLSLIKKFEGCELFDALVSWVFNLGPSNLGASTLLKVINNKDWADVPNQIKRWNKVNGVPNQGLIKRRNSEALLFEGKEWGTV